MKPLQELRSLVIVLGCGLLLALTPATPASARSNWGVLGHMIAATVVETRSPEAEQPEPSQDAPEASQPPEKPAKSSGHRQEEVVSIGKDVVVKAGDTAQTVVVIGGSATIDGKVEDAVVAIGGDVILNGEASDAVVAVLGNIKLGPNARIDGEAVSVGGRIDKAEGAVITGETKQIDFGALGMPQITWLREWFVHCVLKLRPLAPQVGWVWWVAGVVFALYFLIAIAFPRPVQACVDELSRRPATTFLLGLLTKILVPFAILILVATGIGTFVVPFLLAALLVFGVFGKIALMEGLGFQIGKQFGAGGLQKPIAALLLGGLIITLLYMVPIVGLIAWMVLGLWGLGIAISAAFGGLKREMPPKHPPVPGPFPVSPAPAEPGLSTLAVTSGPGDVGNATASTPVSPTPSDVPPSPIAPAAPLPVPPPLMLDVRGQPRAGFWQRMGAGVLDGVLLLILAAMIGGMPTSGLLLSVAYFTALWTWKGTTVGGIVVGLKVVRVDGRALEWHVALIRSLAAAFSVVVLFLGFLWIAWDKEKQGWHDMIAGTVVLRLPRGTPLVLI